MSKFIDHYRMLQVHHEAGQEIINAAYRCFSKMYHPDVNGDRAATEQMKLINIAYNTIGNPRKRRDYHKEWLECHNGKIENGLENIYPPVKNEKSAAEKFNEAAKAEEELARGVLEGFFDDLIKEQWEKSYRKLTAADNRNIPLEEYIEWKRIVSQLYKLGNYKIDYFSTYENCEYAGGSYPKILHFSVTLTEMEIVTGKVNQEQTQKYVALDGGEFKVCLGYSDLKPSIRKFKYLAQALPRTNRDEIIAKALDSIDPLTGIYSRRGFIEQAEKELIRSSRYGNPLTLATVEIRPEKDKNEVFSEEKDGMISLISETLSGNIRKTDIIGRCGDTAIAVLFTETKIEKAKSITIRLLESIEGEEALRCGIYWACSAFISGDAEELLSETLSQAVLKEKTGGESAGIKKLGKYELSDILDFNKKGKNHF